MKGERFLAVILSYLSQMAIPGSLGVLLWLIFRPLRLSFRRRKNLQPGPYRERGLLILFLFLAGLLGLTLTPPGFWTDWMEGNRPALLRPFQGGINLIPFRKSWALFCYYVRHGLWDAVWVNFPGNVVIFLPIGLFTGLLSDKPRWWKGTLWSFLLSFGIEIEQLFVSRGTDIDDMILNTLGGLGGYLLYLLLFRIDPDFTDKFKYVKVESFHE